MSGIEGFILKTDDVFILINAIVGNFKEVHVSLQEMVADEDIQASKISAEPLIKILAGYLESPMYLDKTVDSLLLLFSSLEGSVKRKRFNGYRSQVVDYSYGCMIPDTLAITCACQLIVEELQDK